MREIKFRAWNPYQKKMLQFGKFQWHDEYDLCYMDGSLENPCDDFIWMQFTGFTDKNGRDIYEGDIIKSWYSRDTTGKDIVEFNLTIEHDINKSTGESGFQIDFLENATVIGNIYEHPHLPTA